MFRVVIPARYGSARLPGKVLLGIGGKPMIQWVYEAAKAANVAEKVVVATPDEEIVSACKAFGAEAIVTSQDHQTGTDEQNQREGDLHHHKHVARAMAFSRLAEPASAFPRLLR